MKAKLLTWALIYACWEHAAVAASITCNSTCYGAQISALAELYETASGSTWPTQGEWATIPTLSATDISTVCTILTDSFTGVCCDSSQTACDYTAGSVGIAVLNVAGRGLTGTLPNSLLSALAPTLLALQVSGEPPFNNPEFCPCFPVNHS